MLRTITLFSTQASSYAVRYLGDRPNISFKPDDNLSYRSDAVSCISYHPNISFIKPDDNLLYRSDLISAMIPNNIRAFLAIAIYGFQAREYPEQVTPTHLEQHKGSPCFVSASASKEDAEKFAASLDAVIAKINILNNNFINLDFTLMDANLFNYDLPRENEYVDLCLLYSAIQSFEHAGKEIDNPFYIPGGSLQDSKIKALQNELIVILKNMYEQGKELSEEQKKAALDKFLQAYLAIFDSFFGKNNPFNLTVKQFVERFPQFSALASFKIQEELNHKTLSEIVLESGHELFIDHHPSYKAFTNKKAAQADENQPQARKHEKPEL